jgi:hypothetical protein
VRARALGARMTAPDVSVATAVRLLEDAARAGHR